MKNIFIHPVNFTKIHTAYLKGIGILLILFHNFFHWVNPSTGENEFDFWTERVNQFFSLIAANPLETINIIFSFLGHFGVQLFIFISGYGLVKAFKSNTEWIVYVKSRVLKIYPSFLAGIFVLFLTAIFLSQGFPNNRWLVQIAYKLLFIHTLIPGEALSVNGPWWFYGLIFQLYLVFPFLYKKIDKYGVKAFFIVSAISYVLIFILYKPFANNSLSIMSNFPGHLPEFCLGILLACKPNLKIHFSWAILALFIFIAGNYWFYFFPFTFVIVTFLMVILINQIINYSKDRISEKHYLVYIGNISMFLFAVHGFLRPPLVNLANKMNNPFITLLLSLLFFLIAIGVTMLTIKWNDTVIKIINKLKENVSIKKAANFISGLSKKHKLKDFFIRYLNVFIYLLASIVFMRFVIFLWAGFSQSFSYIEFECVFAGLFREILVLSKIFGFLLPLMFIIQIASKKSFRILIFTLAFIYLLILCSLSAYFVSSHVPLDRVVLMYTTNELLSIVFASNGINIWNIVLYVFPIGIFAWLGFRKIQAGAFFQIASFQLILLSFLISHNFVNPKNENYENEKQYYLASSLPKYFISSVSQISATEIDKDILKKISNYQAVFPQFNYPYKQYPFFNNTPYSDVLGKYFKVDKNKRPNFVFIIVESLSTCYSTNMSTGISVTPFLDSLSAKSLLWPNCVSTSERTFGVLSSIFASAPYGKGFSDLKYQMPDHYSLLKYLTQNDYQSNFFYGGNADFNGMVQFMALNNTKFPLSNTDSTVACVSEDPKNNWGWDDKALFKNSIPIINSLDPNKPRIEIFLTLTSHDPFIFPNKEVYKSKMLNYLTQKHTGNLEEIKKFIEAYSAIFYADDAIRNLFNYYKTRPDFNNTIFIITGDHHLMVTPQYSELDKYHVPLIIYSPLIKEPKTFNPLVSHLDITPSILSFLKNNYNLNISNAGHWMGSGLETNSTFSTNKRLPFIRNSREIIDYMFDSLYLNNGKLFVIQDGLKTKPINNIVLKDSIGNVLNWFNAVNAYTIGQNMLVPAKERADMKSKMVFRDLHCDFESVQIPDYYDDELLVSKNTIEGQKSIMLAKNTLYGSFAPNFKFASNFKKIEIENHFDLKYLEQNSNDYPFLLIQFWKNDKIIISSQHKLDPSILIKKDGYYKFIQTDIFRPEVDISNSVLKIFLHNPGKYEMMYDNIQSKLITY